MAVARIDPSEIGYVEAHGTATTLGDAIEVRALARAFGAGRPRSCPIGSLKSNFGHLGAAAGIAGFVKTVLALQHQELPPSLLCPTPNPQLDLPSTRFFVNTECRVWPRITTPRRAGVSSFGQGGTNAHVVLEEAPTPIPSPPTRAWHVLPISARTPAARDELAHRLATVLRSGAHELADVAYTLHVGRRSFEFRRIVVCRTIAEAIAVLETNDPAYVADAHLHTSDRPVALVVPPIAPDEFEFPIALEVSEPVFRDTFRECLRVYPTLGGTPASARSRVFATQYALAKLWSSWGVSPRVVLGGAGPGFGSVLRGTMPLREALLAADVPGATPVPPPLPPIGYVPLVIAPVKGRLHSHVAGAPPLSCESDLTQTLGLLWLHGALLDRAAYYAGESRQRVPLPTYPFQRRRHWISEDKAARPSDPPGQLAVGEDVESVVARAFGSVLGVDAVGRDGDFFALGGNSLLGIQVLARLMEGSA